ncbi:ECF RNA polymerase sigma factor SigE [Vibrio aerogenes CECT 7868]|uniref:ECF RNA polymerase sigma factor SigE n=1 Tax=Vibrio aerogenes CECT 7868 TaxID=1216006 RepID=A0A1M5ZSX8_9VIBR|nr:sigma-70 family RNA polymerase sigma factor [Vibrio aerogenes]SHI27321.1 ECF RNA polymerase sigma factor SigE [Vibrio aerogenes CECT 7868]
MVRQSHSSAVPCLSRTWHLSESVLFHWLLRLCGDQDLAFDLLQETFLRALSQDKDFCTIKNQQAWLFRVARNLLTDEQRKKHQFTTDADITFDILPDVPQELPPVDSLAQCLPKALGKMSAEDRAIIEACDLQGMGQQQYAASHNLTLPAAKSRIQRARLRLREILKTQCRIRFDEHQKVCCFFPEES